ncbi:MAG: hypothetical protein KIT84_02410 [Labilithrix sp.]|nr:hypothetical protein [Labilithrix sp.]MCW5809838.1 hypothetical protein [Labilithrix sp.]
MKTQRIVAVTTLTLLSAAAAVAKPQGPAKLAVSPEQAANCPIPTLAQCKDPQYLEFDRCGQLQRKNQWTCTSRLKGEMEKERTARGETYDTVPKSMAPEGVGKVIKDPSASGPAKYEPDLYSYTSKQAAQDYGVNGAVFGVNQYAQWEANKNAVESCDEYAFEKYYDVAEFSRRVGDRRDHVKTLQVAFGSGGDPASIGTRHLNDATLRGRDKRPFGAMMQGQRARNVFFNIPSNPAPKGKEPVPAAPNLLLSLGKAGASSLLAKTYTNKNVPNTWSAHKQLAQALLFIPPASPPLGLSLAPVEPDPSEQLKSTFGAIPGPPPKDQKRKRLAKELDELYDLQLRFLAQVDRWASLDLRFAGSGWSPFELDKSYGGHTAPPPNTPPSIGSLQAAGLGGGDKPLAKAPPPKKPGPTPAAAGNLAIEKPETVLRRAVLADMIEIMERADEEGCFDAAPNSYTACDWSPKLFARAVRNTYADEQDAAYEQCMAFTKGSIANAKNVDKEFVEDDDPAYDEFKCRITSGDTITAAKLDDMMTQYPVCRAKAAAYHEQKAHDEAIAAAKARVEKIKDLVDPDTGAFKKPGLTRTRKEQMGGEYFNMGYSYDFGFTFDHQQDICRFVLDTHGLFSTWVTVFGKRWDIIDAEARLSTTERKMHLHANVGGYKLFNPEIDEDWSDFDQKWEWNLTKTVGSGKRDVPLVNTWFTVVVIPVKLEAGISGEAGIDVGLKAEAQGFDNLGQCPYARISGVAEPYASIDGYLEAGIDIFVARVGIRGELNIVRAALPFSAGFGVEIKKADLPLHDPKRLGLFADTRLDVKVSTLSGSLNVFGEVGWCPLCIRGSKEIVSWEGPAWDTNIFKAKYDVNLYDLGVALGTIK